MEYTRELRYEFPLIRGEDVRAVQQALIALHIQPPCGAADGVFGKMTAVTVESFQRQYNLVGRSSGEALALDGAVGEQTWGAIFNRAIAVNATAARIQSAAVSIQAAAVSIQPAAVSVPAAAAGGPSAQTVAIQGQGPNTAGSVKPSPCLNAAHVQIVRNWMSSNFGAEIEAATAGSPFDVNLVCAIACQETALVWLPWIDTMSPQEVLTHCVFDASGDAPRTTRRSFPANTAAFRNKFGDAVTQQLINAANEMRSLRRMPPAQWVYKGYGIFQYDLQNMLTDPDFFVQGQWSDFRACLDRLMKLLHEKLNSAGGDLQEAVRRYNGEGAAAEQYAANVMQMRDWSALEQAPAAA
jgi:putative peptidoglycan binding protein